MARFPEHFIRQVVQATDIVELISQYVTLKKRGREFVGLCPFHDDNRPSLNVSPTKQIFKCFACGAGGGAYQFLMLYEKVPFVEAVRTLAERAGIPLPRTAAAPAEAEGEFAKDELVKVVAFAAGFFRDRLASAEGKTALTYARRRGLTDESVGRFGLGYAPDGWDWLLNAAARGGVSQGKLEAAGLASRSENRCYDRFRNRLMFPIIDPQNRTVGFGGRALDENERAKYVNSPESAVFDKSGQLYALNWAREPIASCGQAVVVEGYLDALIPLQAGVSNVVATMGTALTDRQVKLLSRYAQEIVLIFDADAAGQAAAERALEMFLLQQVHVRVATIPSGKDPCDYCLAEGADRMRQLIDQAPDALQHVWRRRQEAWQAAGGNLADRRRLVEEFLNLVASSAAYGAIDGVRRGQLAQHVAHLVNVPLADVQQQMRRLTRRVPRASRQVGPSTPTPAQKQAPLAERHLLEVLLNCPELFDQAAEKVDPQDFVDAEYRRIATKVWAAGAAGRVDLAELLAGEETADWGAILTGLATDGESRGNHEQTLQGAVEYLLYRRHRRDLENLRSSPDSQEALRELSRQLKTPDLRRHPRIS